MAAAIAAAPRRRHAPRRTGGASGCAPTGPVAAAPATPSSPASSRASAARSSGGLRGQRGQPGQGDLPGGIGEQEARHQHLAGEVVVPGRRSAQGPADHQQVGAELGLVGDGDRASAVPRRSMRRPAAARARHGWWAPATLSRTAAAARLHATRKQAASQIGPRSRAAQPDQGQERQRPHQQQAGREARPVVHQGQPVELQGDREDGQRDEADQRAPAGPAARSRP